MYIIFILPQYNIHQKSTYAECMSISPMSCFTISKAFPGAYLPPRKPHIAVTYLLVSHKRYARVSTHMAIAHLEIACYLPTSPQAPSVEPKHQQIGRTQTQIKRSWGLLATIALHVTLCLEDRARSGGAKSFFQFASWHFSECGTCHDYAAICQLHVSFLLPTMPVRSKAIALPDTVRREQAE